MDYSQEFIDKRVSTESGSMFYKHHQGAGPSIVFIHGLAASTMSFHRLMERLPDDLNVYLVDLIGHGDSDAPEIEYTVSAQVGAVLHLVEKERITPYLFGHSYGGWVAAYYAQLGYPYSGLILEAAAGLKDYMAAMESAGIMDAHNEMLLKEAARLNANMKVVRNALANSRKREQLTQEMLAKISRPTLILWGDEDDIADVRYAGAFNSYIKGSRLKVIPGAGHVPHYERSDIVADELLSFIGYS